MQVLITGIAGFVGGHFVDFLRTTRPETDIVGLVRPGEPVPEGLREHACLIETDLEQRASVDAAIEKCRPDRIVHLAAQSNPRLSWSDPEGTFRTNVFGLLHMLEAIRSRAVKPRILVVGSAEEYGRLDQRTLPVVEETPLRPLNPYATSKVAQGFLARQYALSSGVWTVCTRTFHHTGPGRSRAFAEGSFARQIVEIEAGRRPPVLQVGNLDSVRDFTDVRDVVRAYWALLEKGCPGEFYNVCSGVGIRLSSLVERMLALSRVKIEVRVEAARMRPADVPAQVGDPGKLRKATSWEPVIPLDQTLADLLEHERRSLERESGRTAAV
ncbi:MAG: GDP-mannose 4,6-dehydratase [Vicinamibacteria bacterium]|nr:GDP-mannose 4,6-dehydratase [Vicinamibacteria bacterium]